LTKDKDPVRVAAGKKSKRKGGSNERKLAKEFKEWWGYGEWVKTPVSGGWSSPAVREEFRTCGDIMTTALDFPFCVEAKHQEKWELMQLFTAPKSAIFQFWEQTVDETPEGTMPLLVIRRNHREPLVLGWASQLGPYAAGAPHFVACDTFPVPENFEDIGTDVVILSLKDFFRINPEHFGRTLPDERREEDGTDTTTTSD